jgi:hypothetical protein
MPYVDLLAVSVMDIDNSRLPGTCDKTCKVSNVSIVVGD